MPKKCLISIKLVKVGLMENEQKDGEATGTSDAGILGQSIRGRVHRKHTGLKDIFHMFL